LIHDGPGAATAAQPPDAAETTGRYVVVFADADSDPAPLLRSAAGLASVASSRDFAEQRVQLDQSDATVFAELGVAVLSADRDQLTALRSSSDSAGALVSVSPELVYHPLEDTAAYVAGYRDGVSDLSARLHAGAGGPADGRWNAGTSRFADSASSTWGLQATRAVSSPQSGRGIRVAVLDTGFEAAHPDFTGRRITSASFVPGESSQDAHGHGTHCVGTACGPKEPEGVPRYGVAHGCDIFVGKVLSDSGSGSDGTVLGGMNWAVAQGCHVISMSLGADVRQPHPAYTAVGRRALARGSLVIAAAGNNASRLQGDHGFVGAPANSPYVLAVAALQQDLSMCWFSARSLPGRGGQIDLAAPGWEVYSSWLLPQKHHSISGTSMATPHVTGIAALWAEKTGLRGRELWSVLAQESDRILELSVDVAGGLALAPQ
jgi:subtilisin family serine protease